MNKPLKFVAACRLPTEWGVFTLHGFEEVRSGQEHVALSMGDIGSDAPVLARVHSECLTGDALFSQKCDCGPQLQAAMQAVQQAGRGVIVYLRQEGRGIGLIEVCVGQHQIVVAGRIAPVGVVIGAVGVGECEVIGIGLFAVSAVFIVVVAACGEGRQGQRGGQEQ